MHPALSRTDHRPWPMPGRHWVGRQSWHDLLFAHWPISAGQVRHLVPPELTVDEHGGTSWIGLVPFRMAGVSFRNVADLPGISALPELEVIENTMFEPHGIAVPSGPPICHFARGLDVVVWAPERC